MRWLASIQPIWENRFTERKAAAAGGQRRLLRPVYWLGSWQFACLDYYRPPNGVANRCVAVLQACRAPKADPFRLEHRDIGQLFAENVAPVIARLVARIEKLARELYSGADLPSRWRLSTCLVNLYGSRLEAGKRIDCARVGEHRDFEPGPVASISFGERALFQFVKRGKADEPTRVVAQQWLDDRSLQLFGGDTWKKRLLHRVLRVDRRGGAEFDVRVPDFSTRRLNLTFRYVPEEHVVPFAKLEPEAREDVRTYVSELARGSELFADALRAAGGPAGSGLA